MSTDQPLRRSSRPHSSPLIEPPMTTARLFPAFIYPRFAPPGLLPYICRRLEAEEFPMALSMVDKAAEKKDKSQWSPELQAEFEREANNPNPCVGSMLLSENERTRVWMIKLAPGERIGF